jgi:hypothetical protein
VGTENHSCEALFDALSGLLTAELARQDGRIPQQIVGITRKGLVRKRPRV